MSDDKEKKRYSECVGNKEMVVGLIRERERERYGVGLTLFFLYIKERGS